MSNTINPAAIFDGIRADTDAINAAAAAAQAERDAAAARLEEAEHVARGATMRAERGPGGTAIREAMRTIGDAVDAARATATDAIRNGGDPGSAWVAYRTGAAHLLGTWHDISDAYQQVTGRQAPPGPAHRLPPLPARQGPSAYNAEGFESFLTHTVRQLEEQAHTDARTAAREARRARAAAQS